ncbi:MAG: 2,3-bisphosphoglycerate-independent phosphoglycerate mutase [Dehalococcoidia bacterium]|nr:2,3-bisphosphoglycerate-independent phosphoglycerate mutase [Dehalococcoidia bacterium]
MEFDLIRRLSVPSDTKVLLCVLDGLGGLPGPRGRTELEEAYPQHLDRLVEQGTLGQTLPVGYGITPGSGPGHLALFGYDPLRFEVGRGVIEATGIDFPLTASDVAARGNFCTLDAEGRIIDRRAGRVPTEVTAEICAELEAGVRLPGVELFVRPVREHRFVLVLRGHALHDALTDTDPQREGVAPLPAEPREPAAATTAALVNSFVVQARAIIGGRDRANGLTLRGWAMRPDLPQLPELWKLRAAAVALYPMYRGLARLVGMDVLDAGTTLATQVEALRRHWDEYDFFFLHYKPTDTAGEDGDFQRKQQAIRDFDACLPSLLALAPNVLVITGDHSTPAVMAGHSWHPVPLLMHGDYMRSDDSTRFTEQACAHGALGTLPACEVLPIAFAHARRLAKFGA